MSPTTITVPADAVDAVRDSLIIEMGTQVAAIVDDLGKHWGGSAVGLADASWKCRRVAQLTGVLDDLDPDGWRTRIRDEDVPSDGPRHGDESGTEDVSHDDEGGPQR